MQSRAETNRMEFGDDSEQTRLLLEGARSGCYVRISISGIPVEFIRNFNPAIPIIVGGVGIAESKMGIVTVLICIDRAACVLCLVVRLVSSVIVGIDVF